MKYLIKCEEQRPDGMYHYPIIARGDIPYTELEALASSLGRKGSYPLHFEGIAYLFEKMTLDIQVSDEKTDGEMFAVLHIRKRT